MAAATSFSASTALSSQPAPNSQRFSFTIRCNLSQKTLKPLKARNFGIRGFLVARMNSSPSEKQMICSPDFETSVLKKDKASLAGHDEKQKSSVVVTSMSIKSTAVPIMVNSCNGNMGSSVIMAAPAAGLQILPKSFDLEHEAGNAVEICGNEIKIHGPSDRESVLAFLYEEYPNMIVVDYTVLAALNANADLYCKVGVPFVMGTTGGDRDRLYKTVQDTNNYAVISPQMRKQVVSFLAAMEIMPEQFPGAFSGYSLHVKESHEAGKLDTSGTAKAIISRFEKFGVSFDIQDIVRAGRVFSPLSSDASRGINQIGVIGCVSQDIYVLTAFPVEKIDKTSMWMDGGQIGSAWPVGGLGPVHPFNASVYVPLMIAQTDLLRKKGHSCSEINNGILVECVKSTNLYLYAHGVSFMVDNSSTTPRLASRKCSSHFGYFIVEQPSTIVHLSLPKLCPMGQFVFACIVIYSLAKEVRQELSKKLAQAVFEGLKAFWSR